MRRGLFALCLLSALMAVPGTAHALNVRAEYRIYIDGAPGERNTVTWANDHGLLSGEVYITDATAPITMNGNFPCRRVSVHTVACNTNSAIVNLGDRNDSFVAHEPFGYFCRPCGVQFTVFGGPGDDTIIPGDGSSSDSYGGDGNDTIYVTSKEIYNASGGAGDDKLILPRGYTDRYYGGQISCGAGLDRLVWPKGDAPPGDCEKVTYLPAFVKLLPEIPWLL